jgi:alpha-beta hydrolase superfamily lysophospholipase
VPSEEVTFYSGRCTIAGTFTEAADPVAAALLITGGGRTDRNSDARLPGGRMLRIGADKAVAGALAGARVCALRYDKRGVGASGGEYLHAGMDDRRADARAALGWLAARAGSLPLIAVGHSEGAWYAANWPPTEPSPAPSCSEAARGQPRRSCPGRPR